MSALSFVAVLWPDGLLEPMWQINPRAHEQFAAMGGWALVLMAVIATLCSLTCFGLWRGRRYGFIFGLAMLAVSLAGDLANALLGIEPRAWVGVPIATLFLVTLASRRSRSYFSAQAAIRTGQ